MTTATLALSFSDMTAEHIERFHQRYEPGPGCWLWTGGTTSRGYGHLKVRGRMLAAHRIAWALWHGRWPEEGKFICHSCDTPACVNPSHLWLGTPQQNSADRDVKGRGKRPSRAKLTPSEVQEIRARRALGETLWGIAGDYGISDRTVYDIVERRTWAHVTEAAS